MFGAVSLTKNVDIDKYKYSGYGIGFDRHGEFSFGNGLAKNCIIFGADLSSSSSQKNHILVFGKDFVQGINGTTIYAEKLYKINFTEKNKQFCLSLHYNGASSYLFVNGIKIHEFKAKDTEIVASPLCLGNISKDFSVDNTKKTGLNGYVYDFSVDYDAIAVAQPARDVPGTSPEGPLKVLMSGTSRGPSGDSQGTNTKIDDLMKKLLVRSNNPCFTHLFLFFTEKTNNSKGLNGDFHGTSTGPSCGTSRGPNDGTFWGCPRDVGHICFLNSTHKHIKLTLTGYSRLYSELQ